MVPLELYREDAGRSFEPGTVYRLTVEDQRSALSHNHYFARLQALWENLPEECEHYFPDAEHLRHFALIATGYERREVMHCQSEDEAERLANLIITSDPGGAARLVELRGKSVHVVRPKSQSLKAMSAAEFQQSKEAVIGYCTDLVERRIFLA